MEIRPVTVALAKREGARARCQGMASSECPFDDASFESAWQEGWSECDQAGGTLVD